MRGNSAIFASSCIDMGCMVLGTGFFFLGPIDFLFFWSKWRYLHHLVFTRGVQSTRAHQPFYQLALKEIMSILDMI